MIYHKPNFAAKFGRAVTEALRPVRILPPKEAYRLWADTYDDNSDNAAIQLEEQVLLPLFDQVGIKGRRVVDIGCGTGRHVRHFLERGAERIIGVDFSENMLSVARRCVISPKVAFIHADIGNLPLPDGQFDVAVASLVLSHVKDLERALLELRRVLKPGAALFIADLHWSFDERGWKRSFKSGRRGSERLAVANIVHDGPEFVKAFRNARLSIEKELQPVIDSSLLPIFERTNMLKTYQRHGGEPLLVVYQLRTI